jgi:hypothetical protein
LCIVFKDIADLIKKHTGEEDDSADKPVNYGWKGFV